MDVVVRVANQAALGRLDAAPVQLTLVVRQRRDVLTVPVGALVALAEGGYGVQGTTTHLGAAGQAGRSLAPGPVIAAAGLIALPAVAGTVLLSRRVLRPIGTLTAASRASAPGT